VKTTAPSKTTATQRALLCLHDGGYAGVASGEVGGAVWPEREIRGGRGVSSNGGGDYAAQMLLGRLKKAGLVEYASSEGSSRWRLSTKGRDEVRALNGEKPRVIPARRANGTEACACGCAIEAHGGDPEYPGSTSCTECDCIAYEADLNAEESTLRPIAPTNPTPKKRIVPANLAPKKRKRA